MSNNLPQKKRVISSPSFVKHGPLKATKPYALRTSPLSPTLQSVDNFKRNRRSPDNRSSPDQLASPNTTAKTQGGAISRLFLASAMFFFIFPDWVYTVILSKRFRLFVFYLEKYNYRKTEDRMLNFLSNQENEQFGYPFVVHERRMAKRKLLISIKICVASFKELS